MTRGEELGHSREGEELSHSQKVDNTVGECG